MLDITNHWGNANQNHHRIPPRTPQDDYDWGGKAIINKVSVRMWRNWNPVPCWWECKMVRPLWKEYGSSSENIKMELSFHPAIPLLRKYSKELNAGSERHVHTPAFTAALRTTAETGNPSVHRQGMDKRNVVYSSSRILLSLQKEGNSVTR